MAMKPYLTNEQKALIDDVRRYLEAFRLNRGGHSLPAIHLTPKQYEIFKLIQKKKEKFPRDNAHIPVSTSADQMFGCDVKM